MFSDVLVRLVSPEYSNEVSNPADEDLARDRSGDSDAPGLPLLAQENNMNEKAARAYRIKNILVIVSL